MEEIIRLIIERNIQRKVLNKNDIKRICEIIIKLKRYDEFVYDIVFKKSNDANEIAACYDGVYLTFYKEIMERDSEDFVIELGEIDGTKTDIINYYILSTIFHEFAHVRQDKLRKNNFSYESKIYRICELLRNDDIFTNQNYGIMLDEINAFNVGDINASKIYLSLPNNLVTKDDKDIFRGRIYERLLSKYIVNLSKETVVSPSEQLLEQTTHYDLKYYNYEDFKKVIIDGYINSLYNKLLVELPITFEDYAYVSMFKNNYGNREKDIYIKRLQKRK